MKPITSLYGIFTYIRHLVDFMVNVGEYTIHGCYGLGLMVQKNHRQVSRRNKASNMTMCILLHQANGKEQINSLSTGIRRKEDHPWGNGPINCASQLQKSKKAKKNLSEDLSRWALSAFHLRFFSSSKALPHRKRFRNAPFAWSFELAARVSPTPPVLEQKCLQVLL